MYAKIFTSIYQGTLRGDSHGLLVFTNILAHCDQDGVVDMHPRAIAEEVGLTVEQVRAALLTLEAEDPESRTPDAGGRRIIRLDEHRSWGWSVVNHKKYRDIRSQEDRREANRLAVARHRAKAAQGKCNITVMNGNQKTSMSSHTDADTDTETEAIQTQPPATPTATPPPPWKP